MKQEAIALYRGNVQRTGEYQAVGVPDLHGIAWQFQTGGPVDLTPVVADGIVLLISRTDRTLYALDALTGERRWHCQMSYFGDTPPHVADDVVYVSDDGSILALDLHTGQRLWTWSANDLPPKEQLYELHVKLHIDEEIDEFIDAAYEPWYYAKRGTEENTRKGFDTPICYRDRLYVVSGWMVMALDLATRQPVWWQYMPERASRSSLVIANDQIYLTAALNNNDDTLYGLDCTTGLDTLFGLDRTPDLEPDEEILDFYMDHFMNLRAFTFRDGIFYAIDEGGFFDYARGEDSFFTSEAIRSFQDSVLEWDQYLKLKRAEDLAVGPDMVYVTTHPTVEKPREKSAVIALNRESRQVIWQRSDLTSSPRVRFPTLASSVLYFILDGQICCALDAATGQERWRVQLEKGILAPPCIAGEMVFVAAGPSIYALH